MRLIRVQSTLNFEAREERFVARWVNSRLEMSHDRSRIGFKPWRKPKGDTQPVCATVDGAVGESRPTEQLNKTREVFLEILSIGIQRARRRIILERGCQHRQCFSSFGTVGHIAI